MEVTETGTATEDPPEPEGMEADLAKMTTHPAGRDSTKANTKILDRGGDTSRVVRCRRSSFGRGLPQIIGPSSTSLSPPPSSTSQYRVRRSSATDVTTSLDSLPILSVAESSTPNLRKVQAPLYCIPQMQAQSYDPGHSASTLSQPHPSICTDG